MASSGSMKSRMRPGSLDELGSVTDGRAGVRRIAYDSITGRIYSMGGDDWSEHLVAYDPETGSFAPFGLDLTPDRILALRMDEIGRLYVSGRFDRSDLEKEDPANVVARFDPALDHWEDDVFAPPLWAIAIDEGCADTERGWTSRCARGPHTRWRKYVTAGAGGCAV
jgi:hypothetical protein